MRKILVAVAILFVAAPATAKDRVTCGVVAVMRGLGRGEQPVGISDGLRPLDASGVWG